MDHPAQFLQQSHEDEGYYGFHSLYMETEAQWSTIPTQTSIPFCAHSPLVPAAISVLIEDSRFEKLAESSPVYSISSPLKVMHPPKAKASHTRAGHMPFPSCDFYLPVFMQVKHP